MIKSHLSRLSAALPGAASRCQHRCKFDGRKLAGWQVNRIAFVAAGTDSAQLGTMRLNSLVFLLLFAASSEARIGETSLQFVDRYGAPKDTPTSKVMDKTSPLVEGAIHHTYEYQGWRLRAAFLQLDGPAVRMDFQKAAASGNISIQDYELQAIMTANAPAGMTWSPMAYDNPDSPNTGLAKSIEGFVAVGQKMWRRTDGAILWSRGNLIVRLELPVARQHEAQLKIRKDQKARASVPQF